MKFEILGCSGAPAPGRPPMTLLVETTLMIDAGAAVSALPPSRAGNVRAVLLSHAHLDHIRDLGFLPFYRDADRDGLLEVWGTPKVLKAVRLAVFNPDHWIDFASPPAHRKPGIRYRDIVPETPMDVVGIAVEAVPLTHARHETSGFLLDGDRGTVVYALDSGPTERIWRRARERECVSAVFFDVSFPDRFAAGLDEHLTPSGLAAEIPKLAPHRPRVLAVHLKPETREETIAELEALPFPVEIPAPGDVLDL